MAKKVFITGGVGFIGLAVAQKFVKEGFGVCLFDLEKPPIAIGEYKRGTIMYPDEMARAMQGCEYVIHLAAILGVKKTEDNRLACLDINMVGTKNVLDACVKAGIKKIVFSSSSEVYGEPLKNPIDETHMPRPKSVYAVTKLAGEEYLRAYKQKHNLDFSIVRFFNVYGQRQVAEFVMSRFIKAVLEDKQPTVFGKGNQRRSFCYVKDAAQGVYLALTHKNASGETFNIGNDSPAVTVTIEELARKVIALSGKKMEPAFVVMEKSNNRTQAREIEHRIVNISKARKTLGYNPTTSLDDGISEILRNGNIRPTW